MNIAHWLDRSARLHPQRAALYRGEQPLARHADWAAAAAGLARWWRGPLGLAAGDRVALCLPNSSDYLYALYGAWWAGLAVVPINAQLHPRELAWILRDAEAAVLLAPAAMTEALRADAALPPSLRWAGTVADALAQAGTTRPEAAHTEPAAADWPAPEPRTADDLAWLFYTSGTTGKPKGVVQTHGMLQAMSACYALDVDAVQPDDAIVYAAPMSHGAGLYNFAFVQRGARHVVPASGGFDPAELWALSRRVGRLCLFAAPTMVKRLVDHLAAQGATAADCAGFKTIVYGGGPMYAADIRRARATLGPRFVQIYGQGESPMTITVLSRALLEDTAHPRWAERIASVGVAHSLVELRVADAQGQPLPPGVTGEVLVRGATVMPGYWRNPAASAQALRGGWLWTGDLGALDADGFLTLKDRSKDLVISGGSNIYPREVEEVLLEHPAVAEVAVVGEPDADWGERVVAFVVWRRPEIAPSPNTDGGEPVASADSAASALDAWCLARIARWKRPRHYHLVDALPKNAYGKVLKTALRDRLLASPATADAGGDAGHGTAAAPRQTGEGAGSGPAA